MYLYEKSAKQGEYVQTTSALKPQAGRNAVVFFYRAAGNKSQP